MAAISRPTFGKLLNPVAFERVRRTPKRIGLLVDLVQRHRKELEKELGD